MSWKLKRLRQCEKCPWKVSTDPATIPDGYSAARHHELAKTIAVPGALPDGSPVRVMACHEHPIGEEAHCIGWLWNQMGSGNNIPLRLQLLSCENVRDIQLDGAQHVCFEDTLPTEMDDS